MLEKKPFILVFLLTGAALLSSCFFPSKFKASFNLEDNGSYEFTYEGLLVGIDPDRRMLQNPDFVSVQHAGEETFKVVYKTKGQLSDGPLIFPPYGSGERDFVFFEARQKTPGEYIIETNRGVLEGAVMAQSMLSQDRPPIDLSGNLIVNLPSPAANTNAQIKTSNRLRWDFANVSPAEIEGITTPYVRYIVGGEPRASSTGLPSDLDTLIREAFSGDVLITLPGPDSKEFFDRLNGKINRGMLASAVSHHSALDAMDPDTREWLLSSELANVQIARMDNKGRRESYKFVFFSDDLLSAQSGKSRDAWPSSYDYADYVVGKRQFKFIGAPKKVVRRTTNGYDAEHYEIEIDYTVSGKIGSCTASRSYSVVALFYFDVDRDRWVSSGNLYNDNGGEDVVEHICPASSLSVSGGDVSIPEPNPSIVTAPVFTSAEENDATVKQIPISWREDALRLLDTRTRDFASFAAEELAKEYLDAFRSKAREDFVNSAKARMIVTRMSDASYVKDSLDRFMGDPTFRKHVNDRFIKDALDPKDLSKAYIKSKAKVVIKGAVAGLLEEEFGPNAAKIYTEAGFQAADVLGAAQRGDLIDLSWETADIWMNNVIMSSNLVYEMGQEYEQGITLGDTISMLEAENSDIIEALKQLDDKDSKAAEILAQRFKINEDYKLALLIYRGAPGRLTFEALSNNNFVRNFNAAARETPERVVDNLKRASSIITSWFD